MLKKFLYLIFFILFFTHSVFAQEIFRVTSVNFDTSNSLIFLTSPDNTNEAIMKNVKLIKLQNPKRVYFDINSAILGCAPKNVVLNSGGVKQVKINQFSSNPNKIRIVLFLDENFDQSKIAFLRVNNNIVIKYKDGMNRENYFQNTYREEKSLSSNFYENLSISNADLDQIENKLNTGGLSSANATSDLMLNQIQQAFTSTKPPTNIKSTSPKTPQEIRNELKLKSKYYLNFASVRANGFLINGFGVVGIERPLYLTNPSRVVFDIPNTIVNPATTKEFKVNQDNIKISQFSSNKARIIITSNEAGKYFPIFSADGQSVLFLNSEPADVTSLFTRTTDAVSYYVKKLDARSDQFVIAFNSPVVHSIQRSDYMLTLNLYNALRFNEKTFKNTIADTDLNDMKIDLLPRVGLKLVLPLEKDSVVDSYLGADGKSIKILVKNMKPRKIISLPKCAPIAIPRCNGRKSIVLDAGHGGSDYGAIRSGINEKDINLDVAKRVQAILLSKGVNVYMTRTTDEFVSLEGRTVFTANKNPDIFVSIHVNSATSPDATGLETHYYHPNSLDLAQTVHASLTSYVKSRDRGIMKSRFYVINHTCVPAILVEIGFISNPAERAALVSEERKQQTAQAIAEGILKYLNKR